jgi:hypothetical protein
MQDKEIECNRTGGVSRVWIFESTDWIVDKKTGEYRLKRKYGNRKRIGLVLNNKDNV